MVNVSRIMIAIRSIKNLVIMLNLLVYIFNLQQQKIYAMFHITERWEAAHRCEYGSRLAVSYEAGDARNSAWSLSWPIQCSNKIQSKTEKLSVKFITKK